MSGQKKARALALTAIMVVSVIATGMAFTGTVAADDRRIAGGGDSLQNAIDDASSGDTITVIDDANYNPINVDQENLTIRAGDGSNPTISGTSNNNSNGRTTTVYVSEPGFTLNGFTVDATADDNESTQSATTVYVGSNADDTTVTNNEIVDGPFRYAPNAEDGTVKNNEFDVDEAGGYDTDFISSKIPKSLNGQDNVNDQIASLVEENNDLTTVYLGPSNDRVNYGIVLDDDSVTTGNNDDDATVSGTIYGAEGENGLKYLLKKGGDTVDGDVIPTNADGPTDFTISGEFSQTGDYTLVVSDVPGDKKGSATISSHYQVANVEPDQITEGTTPEVTGKLVDRGGDGVEGEQVDLYANGYQSSDQTDENGGFSLDISDDANLEPGDTVKIQEPDGQGGYVYATIPVVSADASWTVNANPDSVQYEIPTDVNVTVNDNNDGQVNGSELDNANVTVSQNGSEDNVDVDSITKVDSNGDDASDTIVLEGVEAHEMNAPVNVTVDNSDNGDSNDFGMAMLEVNNGQPQPEPATVNFDDQTSPDGKTVTVDSVDLPNDGYVAIHNASQLADGQVQGSVIGVSEYLEAGSYEDVPVTLFDVPGKDFPDDKTLDDGDQTLIAMPHKETNGNEQYNFITSDGSEDGAYLNDNGNAVTDSGTVTYNAPQPEPGTISAEDSEDFGDVTIGDTNTEDVTVTNTGDGPVTVSGYGINVDQGSSDEFTVANDADGDRSFTLGAGESQDLTVTFAPNSSGDKSANLYVNTENDGSTETSLSGTGSEEVQPGTISADDSQAFGSVTVGQTNDGTVTVTNDGGAPVTVSGYGINVDQGSSDEFTVANDADGDRSFTLGAGESQDLTVTFAPTSTGDKSANLYVNTENDGSTNTALTGSGTAATHTLTIDGTDGRTFYAFDVPGELSGTDSLTREDSVRGQTVQGAVGAGSDQVTFTGNPDDLKLYVGDGADVSIDGEEVNPDDYESTLKFMGDGSYSTYNFELRNGAIEDTNSITSEDDVNGDEASGAVKRGSDDYTVTGTFEGISTDGGVTAVLNGQSIDLTKFYNTVRFSGDGSYSFTTNGKVLSGMGITSEDSINGNSANGAIANGGSDGYLYSGSIQNINTDDGVSVDGDEDDYE